ncbi:hypothetical protein D3C81_1296740 [compost metagenome]
MLNGCSSNPGSFDLNIHRLSHIFAAEVLDSIRQRRREQHCDPFPRQLLDDLLNLLDKAHAEHFIRFVNDEGLDPVQRQCAALDMVEHPSRRAYDNMCFLCQFNLLRGKRLLAE